jgi:hypothetical protein
MAGRASQENSSMGVRSCINASGHWLERLDSGLSWISTRERSHMRQASFFEHRSDERTVLVLAAVPVVTGIGGTVWRPGFGRRFFGREVGARECVRGLQLFLRRPGVLPPTR